MSLIALSAIGTILLEEQMHHEHPGQRTHSVRQSATLTLRGVLCGAQAVSQPRLPC